MTKLDAWIYETVNAFGLPNGFPKDLLYSNDVHTKEAASLALYYALKTGEEKRPGMMDLVPYRGADGSFSLVDRYKGYTVASIRRMPNGMFSFFGPKEYVTFFGGRGEFGGIADKMADGEYFNKG